MHTAKPSHTRLAQTLLMLLAALIVTLPLAACGNKEETPAPPSTTASTGNSAAGQAKPPVGEGRRVVDQAKQDASNP